MFDKLRRRDGGKKDQEDYVQEDGREIMIIIGLRYIDSQVAKVQGGRRLYQQGMYIGTATFEQF
jgi:hypothetical protein